MNTDILYSNWAKRNGIEIKFKRVDHRPDNSFPIGSAHWSFDVRHEGKRIFNGYFSKGPALNDVTSPGEIMEALANDLSYFYSEEEGANELIRLERVFRETVGQEAIDELIYGDLDEIDEGEGQIEKQEIRTRDGEDWEIGLKWTRAYKNQYGTVRAEVQATFHYIKGNSEPYFSITGASWLNGREDGFGAWGEGTLREHGFDFLVPYLRWHLWSPKGGGMHYVANGMFWFNRIGNPDPGDHVDPAQAFRRTVAWGAVDTDNGDTYPVDMEAYLIQRLPAVLEVFRQDMEVLFGEQYLLGNGERL